MAQKKRSRKTGAKRRTSRRVSGVGAINSAALQTPTGVVAGIVVGNMVAGKLFPSMDEKIKGAVLVVAGILGGNYLGKNPLMQGLALGVSASGGMKLLQGLGVVSGTGPVIITRQPAGIPEMVAGSGIMQSVAGSGHYRPAMNGMGGGIDASTAAVI